MGETVPGSKEANQMRKDMHETWIRKQFTALKHGLAWVPRILGDGQQVGSSCKKYYCQKCNTMPLREGQWFLFEGSGGKKIWVCPACGGVFSIKQSPLFLGMKTGPGADDVMFLEDACPDHKD
eukprot:7180404-Karenia_brevis.AAC.1